MYSFDQFQKKVSIVSSLFYAFGPAFAISALYQLGYSVLQFASPQIVNLLIDFVQSDEPNWKGYFYTFLICAVTFINTLLNSQTFYQEYIVGLRVKTALISAIYRKSVKLSSTGNLKEKNEKERFGNYSVAKANPDSLKIFAHHYENCGYKIEKIIIFVSPDSPLPC